MNNWSAPLRMRMLGRLEVVSSAGQAARFRSRKALALLAFLALNPDEEFHREQLCDLFWPDSDGDRQAQSLRRAVADIREELEVRMGMGEIVQTRRNYVALVPGSVETDVAHFNALTSGAPDQDELRALLEAVGLYAGELLPSLAESWVLALRADLEERFGHAVVRLCQARIDSGEAQEALRIARAAVLAAPFREDVHIALISGYKAAGMDIEALRQFEEWERLLDENWGEAPSEQAVRALESQSAPATEPAAIDGLNRAGAGLHRSQTHPDMETAGGAVPLGSRFYVARASDQEAFDAFDQGEGVILVHGPRQVGKSSLLARLLGHARDSGAAAAFSDLQSFGATQLSSAETLYKTLAHGLARDLRQEVDFSASWQDWLGPNMNLETMVEELLSRTPGPVSWILDEVDLLFDRAYTNDLFGLLRSWHNRRAFEPDGPWRKLTLVLAYATEAHLFITDLSQSPFNIGVRVGMQDFHEEEVKELQGRYMGALAQDVHRDVFGLTKGHPFLTRRAFAFLAKDGSIESLKQLASEVDGPFGEHLRRTWIAISQDPELTNEVRRLLSGRPFEDPTTRYRLWSSGIIRVSRDGAVEFRVPIYGPYLRAALG
ncbi:MAG: AAA-like domain-containing protein [Armatimonadetes bacterium]|nr:AAA-like domain-containing protein [Armatimonadota bacterium]